MMSSPEQSASATVPQAIDVTPLTLHIGAEIGGVDLTKPLPPEQLKEVREAFLKWKVIFFRGQHLDHAQHALALHLLAHATLRQLLRRGVMDVDGAILENDFVRRALDSLQSFLGRLRAAQVDGADLFAEVK